MRHVAVMSFTASVGLMAIFAVDFVDMVFISMLGNKALAAAVGYAGTLLFFTNSINIGFSIAAGSLVARALGAGESALAREIATAVAILGALIGVVVPIGIFTQMDFVLGLVGASGEELELARRYVSIILPTMPVMAVAMTTMAVLRAYGDARRSMFATLAGGVTNAALDPILIFAVGLGLDGAAIASVIARIVMAGYGMKHSIHAHNGFARPQIGFLTRYAGAIGGIAGPAVLTNVATPVGNAIVMREVSGFGTDAVAAIAVIGRLMPVAFSVVFALSGAIGPIIGQNFGAGQFARVRTALLDGLKFLAIYTVMVAVLLFVLRAIIADAFDAQGEMRRLIYLFCGPLALMQFFNGVIFVCNASFNNLGHPIYSSAINWGRHTIGTLPFVLIGAALAGASGVLIGQAIGGAIFATIALVMARRLVTNLNKPELVDPFASETALHQHSSRKGW